MKFLLTGILTTLKLRLRSVRGWAILLLLPLLVASVVLLLPKQEVSAPVQVGVCLPKNGGEEFWALLEQRSGAVISYILADEDQIDRNVAAGRWDCGLILDRDFDDRLEELDTDRIITLRISSGSVVYPLVRENVSACIAELVSPYIAGEYMLDSGIAADRSDLKARGFRLETLGDDDRIQVKMSTPDGRPLEPMVLAEESVDAILSWLVSVVILVWMLLSATDLGRWTGHSAVRRMLGVRNKTLLMLSRIGADALLAWAAGSAGMLLLGMGPKGCLAVLGYVLLWMAAATVAAHFSGVWNALPVCMPFLVVISLLLSSALVEVEWFLPALAGPAGMLPVSLFLSACGGATAPMLLLFAGAALCLTVSFVTDRVQKE